MNPMIEFLNSWGARFAGFAPPMLTQSAVLIALLLALDLALRKRVRATIRYAVWMLALVKLALPPSLASPTGAAYWLPAQTAARPAAPYSTPAPAPVLVAAPVSTSREFTPNAEYNAAGPARKFARLETTPPTLTWQAVLFGVWLAVASGMGMWVLWRLRMVLGVIARSAQAPEAARAVLESCRRQLGIRRAIPLRCADIGSPAICGVLRPVVLIPPGLAEKLGGSEMRSVLLHELAHYKRGDLWVNLAQILLQIAHWYNPALWLANAGIRRAREQAVDEMVLVEMGAEAPVYPATLLHVAKLGLGRPLAALGLMGILEPGRGLTRRILHIMNRPLPRSARIGARGLAAVLLLALVALPMARPRRAAAAPAQAAAAAPKPLSAANARMTPAEALALVEGSSVFVERSPMDLHTKAGDTVVPEVAFDDVPLMDALFQLAQQSDLNIQFDPALFHQKAADGTPIPPPVVTERWRQVTPLQAMDALLVNYGWRKGWRMELITNTPDASLHAGETNTGGPLIKVNVLVGDNSWQMEANPTNPIVVFRAGEPKSAGPLMTKVNLVGKAPANGGATEEPTNTSKGDDVINVTIDDLPLPNAIRNLAVLAGINIEFDPALLNQKAADGTPIPPPKANEKWKDVTARQALQALLDNYGLEMTQIPGNPILRVAPTDAHSAAPVMTKVNLVGKAPANGGATEEPTNTSKGDDVINVTIDDLPLPNAIRNLAVLAGINIEFDPALLNQKAADGTPIPPPKANEKWTDVTPKQALQKLLDEYGWEITRNPAYPILRIVAKK